MSCARASGSDVNVAATARRNAIVGIVPGLPRTELLEPINRGFHFRGSLSLVLVSNMIVLLILP
jgi:hypothetical protein